MEHQHKPPFTSRHQIMQRLFSPERYDWSMHGIGMLRTYLDPDRRVRLNLWHDKLVNPGISTLHTHPWSLTSSIRAGSMVNRRYERTDNAMSGVLFNEGRITCGPGFNGIEPGSTKLVRLLMVAREELYQDATYHQEPHEIHDTQFQNGTVTVMTRGEDVPGMEASVFWRHGSEWGDASRPFDWTLAHEVIALARARMEMGI